VDDQLSDPITSDRSAGADGLLRHVPAELVGRTVIAIGADLVDIDRMRRTVARTPRFVERVFTEDERRYCELRRDPAERYAARFAAKEAVLKALGTGLAGAGMRDIEVVKATGGKPELVLHGRARDLADQLGVATWLITITHSDHLAQVFVAALADEGSGR
jgi:holo-[acyl-carrier protein] synthase